MRKGFVLALTLLLALVPVAGFAQQGNTPPAGLTATYTGASRGDVATNCDSVTGTGQQTLTATTPPSGLSTYVGYVGVYGLGNGIATTALPTQSTISSGLATASTIGLRPLESASASTALTTGAVAGGPMFFNPPLKLAVNTILKVVGPSAITNVNQLIQACYWFAL